MTTTPRPMTYGHGNCIIILVGQKMGMEPSLIDDAKKHLDAGALHPMTGAAMEREAIRLNDLLRHDPELIAQANAHAEDLKIQHGFASA